MDISFSIRINSGTILNLSCILIRVWLVNKFSYPLALFVIGTVNILLVELNILFLNLYGMLNFSHHIAVVLLINVVHRVSRLDKHLLAAVALGGFSKLGIRRITFLRDLLDADFADELVVFQDKSIHLVGVNIHLDEFVLQNEPERTIARLCFVFVRVGLPTKVKEAATPIPCTDLLRCGLLLKHPHPSGRVIGSLNSLHP